MRVAPLVAWCVQAAKPLLVKHVDNRVTLNLQDVRKIVEELDTSPDRVASRLSGKSSSTSSIFFKNNERHHTGITMAAVIQGSTIT